MVRGRRARIRETTTSTISLSVNGSQLADDQYCASPKRKDCRIDAKKSNKQNTKQNDSSKLQNGSNRGGSSGSGGHQRQIQEMFRAATRAKAAKNISLESMKCSSKMIPSIIQNGCTKKPYYPNEKNNIDNDINSNNQINNDDEESSDKNSNDEIYFNGDNVVTIDDDDDDDDDDYDYNKNTFRNSEEQHTTNIFLQEPVLSLNVDKSPNQPSSIKIKKMLEVDPIFPPNNFSLNLNGQFNKIVTLSRTSPNHDDIEIISNTVINATTTTGNSILLNNDSNSCDSGVVIDNTNKNKNELSPSKRRKPATPHRILCPSPVKYPSIEKTPTKLTLTALSSLLTNDNCQSSITAPSCYTNNAQQKRHPKSRRRLNANHSENSSMTSSKLIGEVILSADTLKKIINSSNNCINGLNSKSILNSAINPTAEQNTNNNFKSHNPPNQQKRNNGHHHNQKESNTTTTRTNTTNNISSTNKKLTDYYPVRRSIRKTKRAVQEEIMQTIEKAIIEGREDGLKIENFEGKGRGIVAERIFKRGEFVVEYIGDLITMSEANQREKKYSLDENAGCYMYYFKHRNQQYCIDATAESGKLGRLVNHSRNGNLITKIVVVKNRPHLVLIAKDDIQPGEEITYDYGDRSKESLLHHPWLAL